MVYRKRFLTRSCFFNKRFNLSRLIMDTKGLQKEFINWCKSKNKQPKSEDETKQLFIAFMKEKHPEEYKVAMENQQKQAQKALHGAKLNYFRTLKNQCAEDEEVVYYKKGGSVNCGCKKKEEGGEVRKAGLGCSAVERFKSIKKAGFGDVLIKIADSLSGGGFRKAEEEKRKRTISSVKKGPGTTKQPTIDGTKKMQEENKKKFKNDYSSKRVKDSEEDYLKGKTNEAAAEKCGGKVKKHQEGSVIAKFKAYRKGGSLNGIPFMQAGTTRGGLFEKKVQDPLPQNPTKEEFINFYGLPSNFFKLDQNTKRNLFMKAYNQYQKFQQPDSTKIIIPPGSQEEPQFNINDITQVLPPVQFDLSRIRKVK